MQNSQPARADRNETRDLGIAILGLLLAIVTALITGCQVRQASKATRDTAWLGFLAQWDDDKMWEAKNTLRSYREDVRNWYPRVKVAQLDDFIARYSRRCIGRYVYHKRGPDFECRN